MAAEKPRFDLARVRVVLRCVMARVSVASCVSCALSISVADRSGPLHPAHRPAAQRSRVRASPDAQRMRRDPVLCSRLLVLSISIAVAASLSPRAAPLPAHLCAAQYSRMSVSAQHTHRHEQHAGDAGTHSGGRRHAFNTKRKLGGRLMRAQRTHPRGCLQWASVMRTALIVILCLLSLCLFCFVLQDKLSKKEKKASKRKAEEQDEAEQAAVAEPVAEAVADPEEDPEAARKRAKKEAKRAKKAREAVDESAAPVAAEPSSKSSTSNALSSLADELVSSTPAAADDEVFDLTAIKSKKKGQLKVKGGAVPAKVDTSVAPDRSASGAFVPDANAVVIAEPVRIFLGNLPFKITDELVHECFGEFGTIEGIHWVTDKATGQFYGTASVHIRHTHARSSFSFHCLLCCSQLMTIFSYISFGSVAHLAGRALKRLIQ